MKRLLFRLVELLRSRIVLLARPPVVDEREFISLTGNHAGYAEKLRRLGESEAADGLQRNAFHVGLCWLQLADEHLGDASVCIANGLRRATYSRAYYATYNASKAVRYIVTGAVSLKGDDHQKAPDLPDDFPDVDKWVATIPKLYEHRLFSDYDNWRATTSEHSITPLEAYTSAESFVKVAKEYIHSKFGI